MFEQTFLTQPEDTRKPYSMALSLLLQVIVIAVFCLLPFVFTQSLPSLQIKSVLAEPPKPPGVLKTTSAANRAVREVPRLFRLNSFLLRAQQPAVTAAAHSVDALPAAGGFDVSGYSNGETPGVISEGLESALSPPLMLKPKVARSGPVRVGTISAANLTHMVQPAYPPLARTARVQGVVEFTATISKEGSITNLVLLHGHPLLVNAARDAVLQWRYRPTLLNGEPVEVITDISVNFTLD